MRGGFVNDMQRKAFFAKLGNSGSCVNRFSLAVPLSSVSEGFSSGMDSSVCKDPIVFSLKDDIRKIVALGDFDIDAFADEYLGALEAVEARYGEEGLRAQALYIAGNLRAMNPEQDKYLDQLLSIGYNKPYTARSGTPGAISEVAYERLVDSFTEYSRNKSGPGLIGMDVFRSFAEMRGIPLDHALAANDWAPEHLTEEARAAVKSAEERVKIEGINV